MKGGREGGREGGTYLPARDEASQDRGADNKSHQRADLNKAMPHSREGGKEGGGTPTHTPTCP